MEACLARAARAWPAALAWETILVCGDASAFFFKQKLWLIGCPSKYFAGGRNRWKLYTKLPLAPWPWNWTKDSLLWCDYCYPAILKGCLV